MYYSTYITTEMSAASGGVIPADMAALSPTSTARSTADSGIESLLVTQRSTRRCITPTIYSTGNDELDHVIIQHCALSEVLLEVGIYIISHRHTHSYYYTAQLRHKQTPHSLMDLFSNLYL